MSRHLGQYIYNNLTYEFEVSEVLVPVSNNLPILTYFDIIFKCNLTNKLETLSINLAKPNRLCLRAQTVNISRLLLK